MNRTAFTIMELLIVVALIAVLVALLLSVISAARQHALSAPCTSNLRQLHVAWSLYREDHHDTYPMVISEIAPYVRSREVFACPRDHYGGAAIWATRRLSTPVSYYYLLSEDLNTPRSVEVLRQRDANHAVVFCVLHGTRCPSLLGPSVKQSYDGKVLQVRVDGSVRTKQAGFRCLKLADGRYTATRPPWALVSDEPCPWQPWEPASIYCGVSEPYVQEMACGRCGNPYH